MNVLKFLEIFIACAVGFLFGFLMCRMILVEMRSHYRQRIKKLENDIREKDVVIRSLKNENTHLTFEHIYRVEPISEEDALGCDFSQNW